MSSDNKRILLRRAAGHIVLQEAQSTDFSVKCVNPSALLSLITVEERAPQCYLGRLAGGMEGGWGARAGGRGRQRKWMGTRRACVGGADGEGWEVGDQVWGGGGKQGGRMGAEGAV